ncbi:MAG: transcription elongation factor GreA [Chloroflexota bacterium]|nr:transcription elongation factor GreA [Chloroflexota bacterium]
MAIQRRIQLTPDGKRELERERDLLREVKRPEQLAIIQELSSEGDVSDNSEYEDVKEELVIIESRIRDIENILQDAEIVEAHDSGGVVSFGSTVTIVDGEQFEEIWTIVGPQESNPRLGKISNVSPVGAALIGKRIGDNVTVETPGGANVFTIKDVT